MNEQVSNDARAQMAFQASKKSTGAAYLLWFFLGGFGAHRFYLGQTGTAVAQLLLFGLGWLTVIFVVGFFLLAVLGVWLLVDAFLIPGLIQQENMKLANSLGGSMAAPQAPRQNASIVD